MTGRGREEMTEGRVIPPKNECRRRAPALRRPDRKGVLLRGALGGLGLGGLGFGLHLGARLGGGLALLCRLLLGLLLGGRLLARFLSLGRGRGAGGLRAGYGVRRLLRLRRGLR